MTVRESLDSSFFLVGGTNKKERPNFLLALRKRHGPTCIYFFDPLFALFIGFCLCQIAYTRRHTHFHCISIILLTLTTPIISLCLFISNLQHSIPVNLSEQARGERNNRYRERNTVCVCLSASSAYVCVCFLEKVQLLGLLSF